MTIPQYHDCPLDSMSPLKSQRKVDCLEIDPPNEILIMVDDIVLGSFLSYCRSVAVGHSSEATSPTRAAEVLNHLWRRCCQLVVVEIQINDVDQLPKLRWDRSRQLIGVEIHKIDAA